MNFIIGVPIVIIGFVFVYWVVMFLDKYGEIVLWLFCAALLLTGLIGMCAFAGNIVLSLF